MSVRLATEHYPPNDEWTQPEYVDWGGWDSYVKGAEVQLLGKPVSDYFRNYYPIRGYVVGAYFQNIEWGNLIFTLHDGKEVDCNLYDKFKFLLLLEPNFKNVLETWLTDVNDLVAYRMDAVTAGAINDVTMPVGAENEGYWDDVDAGFDWGNVKQFWLQSPLTRNGYYNPGYMFLDGIHFTYYVPGERTLEVTVTSNGEPVQDASVTYGRLVGVDPETGEETYFWFEGERQVTDANGYVIFTGLEPDWYGLKVKAEGYQDKQVPDLDLRESDLHKTVSLTKKPPWISKLLWGGLALSPFALTVIYSKMR